MAKKIIVTVTDPKTGATEKQDVISQFRFCGIVESIGHRYEVLECFSDLSHVVCLKVPYDKHDEPRIVDAELSYQNHSPSGMRDAFKWAVNEAISEIAAAYAAEEEAERAERQAEREAEEAAKAKERAAKEAEAKAKAEDAKKAAQKAKDALNKKNPPKPATVKVPVAKVPVAQLNGKNPAPAKKSAPSANGKKPSVADAARKARIRNI